MNVMETPRHIDINTEGNFGYICLSSEIFSEKPCCYRLSFISKCKNRIFSTTIQLCIWTLGFAALQSASRNLILEIGYNFLISLPFKIRRRFHKYRIRIGICCGNVERYSIRSNCSQHNLDLIVRRRNLPCSKLDRCHFRIHCSIWCQRTSKAKIVWRLILQLAFLFTRAV